MLDGYNYKTVGFDKHLLAFLRLNPDEFEEAANRLDDDAAILEWVKKNGAKHSPETIEHWNETMIARHPDTAAKKARFLHFLKEVRRRRPERYPDLLRSHRVRRRTVEVM